MVDWPWPATEHPLANCSLPAAPLQWAGGENWESKSQKRSVWVKQSFVCKQRNQELLPISRQMFSPFLWEGKCSNSKQPFFLFFLEFLCWPQLHRLWDVLLVTWGHLSWLCFPLTSHALPVPSPVWLYEKQICMSPAHQWQKTSQHYQPCVQHKHSPILSNVKRINSTPVKTSTPWWNT